jgi:hypothetical protein
MPAEEERGGRYITMEGGGELRMDWGDDKQRKGVDCGRKEMQRIGRQEKGRGERGI